MMNKFTSLIASIILIFICSSCNSTSNNEQSRTITTSQTNNTLPKHVGYLLIEEETESAILIQNEDFQIKDKELPTKEIYEKYFENIIQLIIEDKSLLDNIQSGQKVKVNITTIYESMPPKGRVVQILSEDSNK
jgi:hypothetical protein